LATLTISGHFQGFLIPYDPKKGERSESQDIRVAIVGVLKHYPATATNEMLSPGEETHGVFYRRRQYIPKLDKLLIGILIPEIVPLAAACLVRPLVTHPLLVQCSPFDENISLAIRCKKHIHIHMPKLHPL
jgi:hypothetical protein